MFPRPLVAAVVCVAVLSSFAIASPSTATPIDSGTAYRVLDHPDGLLATPYYALRLDGLSGDAGEDFTFSAETGGALLTILYDDSGTGSLTFSGTVYGGKVEGNAYVDPQLWQVSFVYTGVTDLGGALESTPNTGSGTITPLGNLGSDVGGFGADESIGLVDKANMDGLSFRLNFGHRAPDDQITGHGWLTHDALEPRTDFQDWLFMVGNPVPEPNTALMIGAGLVVLGSRRHRRNS